MFFFFQAEDGIRDLTVTGVQTCALPIYALGFTQQKPQRRASERDEVAIEGWGKRAWPRIKKRDASGKLPSCFLMKRSEERRVGKECRSRWAAYYLKKKKNYIELVAHSS